jgi:hypothetical protein
MPGGLKTHGWNYEILRVKYVRRGGGCALAEQRHPALENTIAWTAFSP